ncbi:MAG: peptide ABC transporter substrate-binding protein [Dehalococcoidales bacterium]
MKKLLPVVLAVIIMAAGPSLASCSCEEETAGGTLNLYGIDPYTLDPALSGDSISHQYIVQIFSGLVKLNHDLEVVGDIAREWEVSQDGLTYTFHLRPDVYFHDGRPVKAGDFKASWERACSPATGSQTAPLYLGDIAGTNEVFSGEGEKIYGVKALDEHTLEVKLTEPRSYFLYKLAYPTAFVVDTENATRSNWWHADINGTGPFTLREWSSGSRLELERFDDYYGQVASLNRVVYHLWAGTVMDLYETGQIDVAGIGEGYVDKVTDERSEFYDELVTTVVPSLTYIGFNCNSAPFNDPAVRAAFAMAIDMNRVVELVYRGTAIIARGVIPPGIPGYNDTIQGTIFDPDAALDLIAGSSYGSVDNLPPVTLTTGGYGGLIPGDLQATVYQWKENLGIDVTVRQIDPNEYYYNLMAEKDELFYYGWMADYPHPQNFLEVLFSSGSPTNVGQYSNIQYDALIAAAARELEPEPSMELYARAEEILLEETALVPVSFGVEMMLVKPYVKGYEPSPLGIVALNEVRIEGR